MWPRENFKDGSEDLPRVIAWVDVFCGTMGVYVCVYMFRVERSYNRARVHVISLRRDAVGVAFRVGVLVHQGGGGWSTVPSASFLVVLLSLDVHSTSISRTR